MFWIWRDLLPQAARLSCNGEAFASQPALSLKAEWFKVLHLLSFEANADSDFNQAA